MTLDADLTPWVMAVTTTSSLEAGRTLVHEVPELIAVPIANGHTPYLDWLSAET